MRNKSAWERVISPNTKQRGHGSLMKCLASNTGPTVQEVRREANYTELRPLRNWAGLLLLCFYLSLVKEAPARPNNTSLDRGQPS